MHELEILVAQRDLVARRVQQRDDARARRADVVGDSLGRDIRQDVEALGDPEGSRLVFQRPHIVVTLEHLEGAYAIFERNRIGEFV